MAQFLRPDSTVTATAFTNGFANIDEATASDADFAYGANNTVAVLEVGLSDSETPGSGATTVRYRIAKTKTGVVDGSGSAVTVTCAVYQGTTLIAADTARTATGTWTGYSFTPDMSSVTDWNDLRLRFTTSASGGTSANRRGGAVSWAELEAPDAPSGVTGMLAATESGADALAATGTVSDPAITGVLAASEVGNDTAVASGTVTVTGQAAGVEVGTDTAAGTGAAAVSGQFVVSETGSDTATASGTVRISATGALSESGADAFVGGGSVEVTGITGSLAATETGSDTAALVGQIALSGALAGNDAGSDSLSAAGTAEVAGTLDADDQGTDILDGSGSLEAGAVTGTLEAAEAGEDGAAIFAQVLIYGMLTAAEIGEDIMGGAAPSIPASLRTVISADTGRITVVPKPAM